MGGLFCRNEYRFAIKLPKIAYCYSGKQFKHYSKLSIKMVTIVDFGTFLECQLKSTMAHKELNVIIFHVLILCIKLINKHFMHLFHHFLQLSGIQMKSMHFNMWCYSWSVSLCLPFSISLFLYFIRKGSYVINCAPSAVESS